MYKGTSASAGIGIGKAVIVEEVRLVIAMQAVTDVEEEVQRFKGALDETIKATENWQRTWQPGWERRKRKSCRDI